MKKFYGLTGTKLNIAIAIIAGIDFALFGYDQVSSPDTTPVWQLLTRTGRVGRSSDAPIISEIFPRDQRPAPSKWHNPLSSL